MQEKYRPFERFKCKIYVSNFSFFIPNSSLRIPPKNAGLSIVTTFIKTPPLSAYNDAEKNDHQ